MIQDFADRCLQYSVSQMKLAVMAGISRKHLRRIESGKVAVTEEMKASLLETLEKFNPEALLTMLFDYVRIRFLTLDIGHIIKDILQLNIQYMKTLGITAARNTTTSEIFSYTLLQIKKKVSCWNGKEKAVANLKVICWHRNRAGMTSFKLVKHEEQDKAGMGRTLYIGSLKSAV